MEEERSAQPELDKTESGGSPEAVDESQLQPEERARRLFASYLAPAADEVPPEPEPEEPGREIGDMLSFLMEDRDEGESEEELPEGIEAGGKRAWYVVHSYSGYESKVKKNLEHRIESQGMQDKIFEVVVPTEEEIELKDGQRRTVERRIFPGYILVEMVMDKDSWHVVRNTPGVTGFVGSINKPSALPRRDVERIIKRMAAETPKVKVSFKTGQKVRIADGPFEDFVGAVDSIYPEKGKVRILVSFFGRETPVELDFLQVEKI